MLSELEGWETIALRCTLVNLVVNGLVIEEFTHVLGSVIRKLESLF
jgi:hypothetical protein